jgi:hypothetical protein
VLWFSICRLSLRPDGVFGTPNPPLTDRFLLTRLFDDKELFGEHYALRHCSRSSVGTLPLVSVLVRWKMASSCL